MEVLMFPNSLQTELPFRMYHILGVLLWQSFHVQIRIEELSEKNLCLILGNNIFEVIL